MHNEEGEPMKKGDKVLYAVGYMFALAVVGCVIAVLIALTVRIVEAIL